MSRPATLQGAERPGPSCRGQVGKMDQARALRLSTNMSRHALICSCAARGRRAEGRLQAVRDEERRSQQQQPKGLQVVGDSWLAEQSPNGLPKSLQKKGLIGLQPLEMFRGVSQEHAEDASRGWGSTGLSYGRMKSQYISQFNLPSQGQGVFLLKITHPCGEECCCFWCRACPALKEGRGV